MAKITICHFHCIWIGINQNQEISAISGKQNQDSRQNKWKATANLKKKSEFHSVRVKLKTGVLELLFETNEVTCLISTWPEGTCLIAPKYVAAWDDNTCLIGTFCECMYWMHLFGYDGEAVNMIIKSIFRIIMYFFGIFFIAQKYKINCVYERKVK